MGNLQQIILLLQRYSNDNSFCAFNDDGIVDDDGEDEEISKENLPSFES